ncbi:hypothetical protein PsW74_04342 [Pseudovibrio sp. W74]|nr:hypothetical protein PsW74_04342 [Pseudovibrio sp. W74]
MPDGLAFQIIEKPIAAAFKPFHLLAHGNLCFTNNLSCFLKAARNSLTSPAQGSRQFFSQAKHLVQLSKRHANSHTNNNGASRYSKGRNSNCRNRTCQKRSSSCCGHASPNGNSPDRHIDNDVGKQFAVKLRIAHDELHDIQGHIAGDHDDRIRPATCPNGFWSNSKSNNLWRGRQIPCPLKNLAHGRIALEDHVGLSIGYLGVITPLNTDLF